jgi:hypothetical protein
MAASGSSWSRVRTSVRVADDGHVVPHQRPKRSADDGELHTRAAEGGHGCVDGVERRIRDLVGVRLR